MEIGKQLSEYFDSRGVSQVDIASQLGVSKAYVNALFTGRSHFGKKQAELWEEKFGLSKIWLLTGEGDMLVDGAEHSDSSALEGGAPGVLVPLVHIDSVGGIHSVNEIMASEQYVEAMIPFPDARAGDFAIQQSGDSMVPVIPSGAILQIRRVDDWQEFFGYGNVYVLWLKDDRRITKLVKRYDADPRNYVMCCSYNPAADDEELPRSFIREVWKVVNVLINKGW